MPVREQPETIAGGFPTVCGGILGVPASARDRYSLGGRNVPMNLIASSLSSWGHLDHPVVNQTGLNGPYDFVLEFTPDPPPAYAAGVDSGGPTFTEALKQQLGMKLEPQKAPVEFLVIDHIEHLSDNFTAPKPAAAPQPASAPQSVVPAPEPISIQKASTSNSSRELGRSCLFV